MVTKLHAARIAAAAGIATIIAYGGDRGVLRRAANGEAVGTFFLPAAVPLRARQRWLAFAARPRGHLTIDEGARSAVLERGRSLLPAGIVRVEGHFEVGDLVALVDRGGTPVAVGLSGYNSSELHQIVGQRSDRITAVLGHGIVHPEAVHRDNLVVLPR